MLINIENTKRAVLGECPLWDYRKNILYFVDIEGRNIRLYDPESKTEEIISAPQMVGCIALCADGRLLAAMEDGIYYLEDGAFTLAHKEIKIEGTRFNDGKVGPDGRFYAGTLSRNGNGAFYRLDSDGDLTKLFGGNVYTSNGMDWSPDSKIFYYIDTHYKRIDAFEFDIKTGLIAGGKTIYDFKDERPDGMCIDEQGNLNVAIWASGKVVTVDPNTRSLLQTINIPALQTTCPVFGGKNLSTMFITSAYRDKEGDPKEALAGMLFSVEMPYRGVKTNLFG